MLAFVKEPHIRLSMDGPTAALPPFIDFLRTQYTVEVEEEDDDKPVDIFQTDFWKQTTSGDLLAGGRWLCGLTQAQLAEKSGINATTISAYEHNRRRLTMKAAIRLAKAMGVKPETLFP